MKLSKSKHLECLVLGHESTPPECQLPLVKPKTITLPGTFGTSTGEVCSMQGIPAIIEPDMDLLTLTSDRFSRRSMTFYTARIVSQLTVLEGCLIHTDSVQSLILHYDAPHQAFPQGYHQHLLPRLFRYARPRKLLSGERTRPGQTISNSLNCLLYLILLVFR